MDATREHLWGQLLVERCVVAPPELAQLAQARDQYLRQGQDCSLAGLLMQQQRLDQQGYAQLHQELEGRGRACFQCKRVFLAQHPAEPPACPGCGGPTGLGPPGTGAHQAYASGRFQAPSASGRFQAPTGHYPAASGHYPAQHATGHYPAQQQHPSGHYPRPHPSGGYAPPGSGGYPAAAGSVRMQAPGAYNPQADQLQPSLASLRWSAPRSTPSEQDMGGGGGDVGVGKRFGRYEIIDELGRGGMGVVYRVRDPARPQQFFALKVLLAGEFASPKLLQRFRDEAAVASKLRHPNIVAVQDVGEVDGIPYYAMDYVKGNELQDLIRQKNLSVRRGAEILVEVARAAHHAHEHGVIHRDLKPSNVLIGEDGTPFIMDFGLAKNLEQDKGLTRSGVAIGTPYYMPPEQARGQHREMDARSDVYAIGAILYEILTRRVPFTAKTQNELLRKIIETEPQSPRQLRAGIPVELETICIKALHKEKSDRYTSALALADDLGRFLSGMPIQARPLPIWVRAFRKAKKNKQATAAIAGIALVVLIAVGAVIRLTTTHEDEVREREEANAAALEAAQQQQQQQQAQQQQQLVAQQALDQKRKDADLEVNRALERLSKARMATTASPAREALKRAEEALTTAVQLEGQFTEHKGARPSTAYRRGVIRRDLCRWDQALQDFELAARAGEFQARSKLQEGIVRLRAFSDVRGALTAFSAAQAIKVETHQTEERGAQDIARAYQTALEDNPDEATRLLSIVLERGDVTLTAEANGTWAYIGARVGTTDAGELDRALRRAEQAVQAEKFRFCFVVDLGMLLARTGKLPEAKVQLQAARALDGDAPDPDLVLAIVALAEGQGAAMRQALQAARDKARDRGARALDAVRAFEAQLAQGPAPAAGAATDPRRPPPAVAKNVIRGDAQATINFSPGTKVVQATLIVGDETPAIKLKLTHADRGTRVIARFGQPIQSATDVDHVQTSSDGDDLVLVLRRDAGDPPLRTGTYYLAFLHPNPTRELVSQLTTTYYREGQELPHLWKALEGGDLQLDRQFKAEADRLAGEFGSKPERRAAIIEAWAELEKRANAPQLALIRGQWLQLLDRHEEALQALELIPTDGLQAQMAHFVAYQKARCQWLLDRNEPAAELLRGLLNEEADYLEPRLLLAQVYLEQGEPRKAYKITEAIRKLDPDADLAAVLSGVAILGVDAAKGLARLEEEVRSDELSQPALTRAFQELMGGGQAAKAAELIEVAVQAERSRGSSVNYPLQWELFRGMALAQSGDVDQALARLEKVHASVSGTEPRIQIQKLIDKIKADAGR